MNREQVSDEYNKNRDFRCANLYGVDVHDMYLRYADMEWADLRFADMRGADLSDADLRYADLRWADLRWANLCRTDVRHADLRWTNLRGAKLQETKQRIVQIHSTQEEIVAIDDDVRIGRYRMSLSEWLENYYAIGLKNNYSESEIKLYGKLLASLLK